MAEGDKSAHGAFLSLLIVVALLALVVDGAAAARPAPSTPGESPFIAVSRAVRPAVVNIRITRSVNDEGFGTGPLQEMFRQFFPDEEGKGGRFESPSTGSGFVVDAGGEILTNHHVVAGADAIFVRFSDEKVEYKAEVVGSDPNTDLALLRIDAAGRDLPVLSFADSDALEVGAWAIAVGNPFGNLESSLTVGVVSAKGRGDLQIGGLTPRYQDFIQTDAAINHGNSGGPLVDIAGRVVGVNTAISSRGQGIGFAVPSNLVQRIYRQLQENGRVVRGYLGVWTEDVVQIAGEEAPDLPQSGARVVRVAPGSPAEVAGLQPDDIVIGFAGQVVDGNRELQFLIAEAQPGRAVAVTVARGARTWYLEAVPSEWTEDAGAVIGGQVAGWLGMQVAAIESDDPRVARLKSVLGVEAMSGVMVVAVQDGEPAAEAGIRPGDVLVTVDGREINDLPDYDEARLTHASQRTPLLVLVRTGGTERYVEVTPRQGGVEN